MKKRAEHDQDFYEQLAPLYHLKVEWDKRLPKETALFDFLLRDPNISAVCDLGCGDGGHANEVSKRGAMYVGIDSSAKMIAMAKRRYVRRKGIRFLQGDMLDLPREFHGMFDLVMLLGNTLPHILLESDLRHLMRGVSRLLTKHGRFVIQTVSPGLIKNKQIHFLAPKLANGRVLFTPFYARQQECWSFQMPIYIIEHNRLVSQSVLETRLRFWSRQEIVTATGSHFRVVKTFGSAGLSPYSPTESDNLVIVLEKI